MRIRREWIEELIFRGDAPRRYTQDSPVLPDVWIEFALALSRDPLARVDLLLTPHRDSSASALVREVRDRMTDERETFAWMMWHGDAGGQSSRIAYNQASVVGEFTFPELIRVILPLCSWWRRVIPQDEEDAAGYLRKPDVRAQVLEELDRLARRPEEPRRVATTSSPGAPATLRGVVVSQELVWMIRIVGTLLAAMEDGPGDGSEERARFVAASRDDERLLGDFVALVDGMVPREAEAPTLYTVTRNRRVTVSIARSVMAVKGDAARRLFEIDTEHIAWAVIDSGIDARHPAFRKRENGKPAPDPFDDAGGGRRRKNNHTTVAATYDFSRIRALLDPEATPAQRRGAAPTPTSDADLERAADLTRRIQRGNALDWDELSPFLQVLHDERYLPPAFDHGTHVAGILGADWRRADDPQRWPGIDEDQLLGVCPGLMLYDLRVFDEHGYGDEFTVMAALQFVRHLNAHRDQPSIHGVNLSLSLKHDVANYACGRTPVCDECERVVASGVVVVAAAGNDGYLRFTTPSGESEGYRSISISDPGNAESVITVGATHRHAAHTYGVSYFSSRGPTGDGRTKPDLVAPGEKITAPVPGDAVDTKDGTSMAAPHVSGAAVILMARHRELLGNPRRVKDILCRTATDLGRERYFQGAGMVDILRALQSV